MILIDLAPSTRPFCASERPQRRHRASPGASFLRPTSNLQLPTSNLQPPTSRTSTVAGAGAGINREWAKKEGIRQLAVYNFYTVAKIKTYGTGPGLKVEG